MKGGGSRSLVRCPIEGKLRMREEFIPPLDTLLHKGSKQRTQRPVCHLSLAIDLVMACSAKLEVSPHLPPQSKPKVA